MFGDHEAIRNVKVYKKRQRLEDMDLDEQVDGEESEVDMESQQCDQS